MPIFNGTNNIANIYHGNNQILKVFHGSDLKYELSLFGTYELIADVEVSSTTNEIVFSNLNFTKDDEFRIIYTFIGNTSSGNTEMGVFPNNFTNTSDYTTQWYVWNATEPIGLRTFDNRICPNVRSFRIGQGYADIKIAENGKYNIWSKSVRTTTSTSASGDIEGFYMNVIGDSFTISNIDTLTVKAFSNSFGVGTRVALYKISGG